LGRLLLWLDSVIPIDSLSLYLRLYGRFGAAGLVLIVVFLAGDERRRRFFDRSSKAPRARRTAAACCPAMAVCSTGSTALLPVFPDRAGAGPL